MNSYFDLYKNRVSVNGVTHKETESNKLKRIIEKDFENSPSYYDITINNNTVGAIINSNGFKEGITSKFIIVKIDIALKAGDLIGWSSENWLCTFQENIADIYNKGIIKKCNKVLSFVVGSNIIKTPCIVESKTIDGQGEGAFDRILLPDGIIRVTVSRTTDTDTITRDSRFIIDGLAYNVTNIDKNTKGLLILSMTETVVNTQTDDVPNNVADKAKPAKSGNAIF